jgi:hypothetical protein
MSSYIHRGTSYGGSAQKSGPHGDDGRTSRHGAAALKSGKDIVQEASIRRPGSGVSCNGSGISGLIGGVSLGARTVKTRIGNY